MKFTTSRITFVEVQKAKAQVRQALDQGDFTLDFEGVSRVDSTVLALSLYAYRRAKAVGGTLQLKSVPAGFMELVRLYGLETLLQDK